MGKERKEPTVRFSDWLCALPSPTEEARSQIAASLVSWKDNVMRQAINYKLGSDEWNLEDIAGRGEIIIDLYKKETLVFDGEPLVEFYPPEFELKSNGMITRQSYRLLYT